MRTTWQPLSNETKPTLLLALTFLFLFSGSSVVFGDDFQDGVDAHKDGFDAHKRKDYKEALRLFRLSADQGHSGAQFNLGQIYRQGLGVPQDDKEAVRLYRISADQGYAKAQYNLGAMYAKGKGVPQDYKEAVKWYRLSAEQGLAEAQFTLGYKYFIGQGVPQDYVLAHMWSNICGSSGHKGCVENRNIVEKEMSKSQIQKAQEMARKWKPKQESKGLFEQFRKVWNKVTK